MATEYAGTATYHATVTVVDDGDEPTAASVAAGLQDCADREAYLKGKTDSHEITATRVSEMLPGYSPSVVRTLVYGRNALQYVTNSAEILYYATKDLGDPWQIAQAYEPTGALEMVVELTPSLPHGSVIHSIAANIEGSSWATLPTLPQILLMKYEIPTDTWSTIATMSDTSASVAQLNTKRQIYWDASGTGINHTVASHTRYFLKFLVNTGGSGSSRSLTLRSVEIGVKGQAL